MSAVLHLSVKRVLIVTCLCCSVFLLRAQDPIFTQYYNNKNYLNPAFAGFTSDLSVTLSSRLQYLSIPGVLATNTLAANIGCNDGQRILGYGFLVYDHVEGEGLLHTLNVAGQLSANVEWNTNLFGRKGNKALLAGGLQFGLGQKFLDWDRLTFSDQYSPYVNGLIRDQTTILPQQSASNIYLDLTAGVRGLFEFSSTSRPRLFQYGLSVSHINRPVQTFFVTNVQLEPRYSAFAFTHISNQGTGKVKSRKYWTFGLLGDYQQGLQSHTLIIGKETGQYFTVSVGYRRERFFQFDRNFDALLIMTMFTIDNWLIGVSYDWTLSALGEENTFGTVEIGIRYTFRGVNTCRTDKTKCPERGFSLGHEVPKLGM
jgi:type IX secretion system PorP/SprF family membrane protein